MTERKHSGIKDSLMDDEHDETITAEVLKEIDKFKLDTAGDVPPVTSKVKAKEPPSSIWWATVTEGVTDPNGRTVKEIISRSPTYFIYFDQNYNLCCSINDETTKVQELFRHFDTLREKIKHTLGDKDKKAGLKSLGRALSHVLDNVDAENVLSYFDNTREYVDTKAREKLHKYYLSSTFLFSLTCVAIFLIANAVVTSDVIYLYFQAGALGAMGALVSVLQRFRKMEIQAYTSPSYIIFEGFSRILLGVFFGIIFVLASKGGLLLGNYADNPYALSVFTIIAGLSERLIPEFIETIDAGGKDEKEAEAGQTTENRTVV